VQVIAGEPAGVLLDHRGPLDETHAVVRVGGSAVLTIDYGTYNINPDTPPEPATD